ncbi:MAG: rhodanese-related sulfurtransferase, partial [Pseudomonadota bacterium]
LIHRGQGLSLKGTVLVATEGLNGTIAGSKSAIAQFVETLAEIPGLAGVELKYSAAPSAPFHRFKVKLRKEIVSMGVHDIDPARRSGKHVGAQEWDALLDDPSVLVLDTRNDYEYAIGRFSGAKSANTTNFREFPDQVDALKSEGFQKVAMYCTGGIRCEKASALLLAKGFEQVYQLDGGILRYLEDTPAARQKWEGECFVFDSRVAVKNDLSPGSYEQCHACRRPLSATDMASNDYQPSVSCPHCVNETTTSQRKRFAERRRQVALAAQRGANHIGDGNS